MNCFEGKVLSTKYTQWADLIDGLNISNDEVDSLLEYLGQRITWGDANLTLIDGDTVLYSMKDLVDDYEEVPDWMEILTDRCNWLSKNKIYVNME